MAELVVFENCTYLSQDGVACSLPRDQGEEFCLFHKKVKSDESFLEEINKLTEKKYGNWTGFKFPNKFEFKDRKIDFTINLSYSEINELIISKVTFQKDVIFKECVFKGNVHFYSTLFEGAADFENGKFQKELSIDSRSIFYNQAHFYKGEFLGKIFFSCLFKKRVNFNNSIFYDGVTFKGTRIINISSELGAVLEVSTSTPSLLVKGVNELSLWQKITNKLRDSYSITLNYIKVKISHNYKEFVKKVEQIRKKIKRYRDSSSYDEIIRVFESEADFQEVEFREPGLTKFININLSKAYISGTNFRKVTLQDIVWSNELGREGIYDEIRMKYSKDKNFKKYVLPRIEDTYRNLRVALEENKDFGSASDFYVGEMEAARLQKPFFQRYLFSVVAIYRILSRYGTSPIRAVLFFIFLSFSYSIFTAIINNDVNYPLQIIGFNQPICLVNYIIQILVSYFIFPFRVLTYLREAPFSNCAWQNVLDAIFRILGSLQLALIVLALRAKVKRH